MAESPRLPRYDDVVSADDPFPREHLATLLGRLPAYLRLTWHLGRDPMVSRARRAALVAAAGYVASPVDLVPGLIPLVGQLDDVAVALAAIRLALDGLSPERRRRHLDAVGLTEAHLADDLRALAMTTAWLARTVARETGRAGRAAARAGRSGASQLVDGARGLTRAVGGEVAPRTAAARDRTRETLAGVRRRLPRMRSEETVDRDVT